MTSKKNSLDQIEIEAASDIVKRKRKKLSKDHYPQGERSRIAKEVRARTRLPPPVPKNKGLAEIRAMDPEDKAFRHNLGKPRKYDFKDPKQTHSTHTGEELSWKEKARKDNSKRKNERRAKMRKAEAETIVAVQLLAEHVKPHTERKYGVADEDLAIAEGILNLDDWDDEELIRGYRKNRQGHFGKAPRYITQEVQQEAFRRLVHRGDRKMREAYLETMDELVRLARDSSSEKVRLEAIKEIQNRLVGKVPERVHVGVDQPWEGILADSLVPISEVDPIDMQMEADGVARALPEWGTPNPADVSEGGPQAPPSPETRAAGDRGSDNGVETGPPSPSPFCPGSLIPAEHLLVAGARKAPCPDCRRQVSITKSRKLRKHRLEPDA